MRHAQNQRALRQHMDCMFRMKVSMPIVTNLIRLLSLALALGVPVQYLEANAGALILIAYAVIQAKVILSGDSLVLCPRRYRRLLRSFKIKI